MGSFPFHGDPSPITSKDKYLRPGLINPFLVRQTPAPPTTTTPPVVISHSKNHPTSNNKFPLLHNNQTQQLHTVHSQNDGPQSRRQNLLRHLSVQRRRRQTRRGRLLRHLVRTMQGHRPRTRQVLRIARVQGQGRLLQLTSTRSPTSPRSSVSAPCPRSCSSRTARRSARSSVPTRRLSNRPSRTTCKAENPKMIRRHPSWCLCATRLISNEMGTDR